MHDDACSRASRTVVHKKESLNVIRTTEGVHLLVFFPLQYTCLCFFFTEDGKLNLPGRGRGGGGFKSARCRKIRTRGFAFVILKDKETKLPL